MSSASEPLSPSLGMRESREFASEIKYLIPEGLGRHVEDWARRHLAADPHGTGEFGDTYHTASLYFDTAGLDVLNRSGSFGRSKYRIRRYGLAASAFVERKLKVGDLVSKRRSVVAIPELESLVRPEPQREWAGYWFHRRIRKRALAPVCQISYVRMARVANTGLGPIRLTLDRDLRARNVRRMRFEDDGDAALLAPQRQILELKFRYALPELFAQLVDQFQLETQPVSKYRLAAAIPGCVAGVEPTI